MGECWCGKTHVAGSDNVAEAWEHIWHEVVAAMRVPQMVAWLARRLDG